MTPKQETRKWILIIFAKFMAVSLIICAWIVSIVLITENHPNLGLFLVYAVPVALCIIYIAHGSYLDKLEELEKK